MKIYTEKQALWRSPWIGALLASVVFYFYFSIISILKINNTEHSFSNAIKILFDIFMNMPIILMVCLLMFYIISIPIILLTKKITEYYYLSEKSFKLIAFICFLIIAIILKLIQGSNDYIYSTILIISISLGGLTNTTLYLIYSGKINIKS